MLSRLQKAIFILMVVACAVMGAVLIRLRERAEDRLQAQGQEEPAIADAQGSAARAITLYVPNDLDESLTTLQRSVPMPEDQNAQARVLLGALVDAFRA